MRIELLFALSGLLVAPVWLLMIGLPGLALTRAVLGSPWVLLPLPLLYTVLLIANWPLWIYLIENPTLTGLAVVLGSPMGALIAWVHLLALDLFVGRWIYLDSQDRGMASLAVVPVLWLTLLAGPIGLMLYLVVRPLAGPTEPAAEREQPGPSMAPPPGSPTGVRKPTPGGGGAKPL